MNLTTGFRSSGIDARLSDSLNYFLIEISGKVQLTKTHREKAEGHYGAVADLLKNSPHSTLLNKVDTKMIPFGGLGTNTATKPFKNDEFDLDLIVRLATTKNKLSAPLTLFNAIHDPLRKNDVYKDKLEVKDRCLRIYYSGDFHLDLMPAVLDDGTSASPNRLWIPERQDNGLYEYVLVDPIGLMDWFEKRCKIQKSIDSKLANERAEFETMPLLSDEARKPVLKQATQLIKRARDVYFSKDDDCKKILKSVVILTLAGHSYNGQTDLYRLVTTIINSIDIHTADLRTSKVENPVNREEDFLESLRKNPSRHIKLRKFIADFRDNWINLIAVNDLDAKTDIIKKLFGETVTTAVFDEYSERLQQNNMSGLTRMNAAGMLGVSGSAVGLKVPRHQFFGDR